MCQLQQKIENVEEDPHMDPLQGIEGEWTKYGRVDPGNAQDPPTKTLPTNPLEDGDIPVTLSTMSR